MATDAAVVFHQVEPIGLFDLLGYLAVLLAELARRGNLQHRVPVDRRVILRRDRLRWRGDRAQTELLAGLAVDLGRIDQAIAAHPQLIFGLGKVGHHEAALIVGDDHLGVARGEIRRFRDHPDAGLQSVRTGDLAADIIVIDGDGGYLLGAELERRAGQHQANDSRRRTEIKLAFARHALLRRLRRFYAIRTRPIAGTTWDCRPNGSHLSIICLQARHAPPVKSRLRAHVDQWTNVPPRSSSIWMR